MDQHDTTYASGEKEHKDKEFNNMASLLKEEGLGLELPEAGEIKTGTIASISPGQIMVGIGAKSEGIINGQEFELIPPDIFASMEVGQEISVYVVTPEDHIGNLILSYIRAVESEAWQDAEEKMNNKESFTGKVVGYNRGGLIVAFRELQGFVPASLLSYGRRSDISGETAEKRFGEMMGEELPLQIIEVDQERRRLIFSEKAAVHETRDTVRDKVIEKLNIGDIRTGRVTSLADFGAFVNINGADGLVHVSEISWDKVRHPGDELKVGQEVEVKVISIDEEKRHIGLSIRLLKDDPWQEQIGDLRVGQLVEAKITRLTKFGAFAMLDSGIEGLIHISEISEEHIVHPKGVLHEGADVTLRVIKVEPESHRIGLSLRRVESLAFADMDLKALEKELEDTDIKVVTDEVVAISAEDKEEPFASASEAPEAEATEEEATKEPETISEEPATEADEPVTEPKEPASELEEAMTEPEEPTSEPESGEESVSSEFEVSEEDKNPPDSGES
ncbi:MAG TPA: S1 RNA-binding domain-containing protein [Pelolinea sp.]|nr:S1 RNA-binding domain-containing protein [Pelolinea sp.]